MIIERTIAPVFAANCYVLAPAPGKPALVVDPGAGATQGALALLRLHQLKLGAILLTHGHADHVWDTQALITAAHSQGLLASDTSDTSGASAASDAVAAAPVYIPAPDLYRLEDPDATTGITVQGISFADLAGSAWSRPSDVRPFPNQGFSRGVELIPDLAVQAVAAPGHSEGSSVFFFNASLGDNALLHEAEVPEVIEADPAELDQPHDYQVALAGDVIFKGAVGRTDLPGGDQVQMLGTLRFLAQAIAPTTVLLPGHGAATTMEHEHHANPYLAEAKIRGGDLKA